MRTRNSKLKLHFLSILVLVVGTLFASSAHANWTLNVGYQNPIVSTWGLNLLYIGSQWGFEAGIGWIDAEAKVDEDEPDNNSNNDPDEDGSKAAIAIAGDIDLKYFFASGAARPFLQGGFGVDLGAKSGEGAGAGTGGGFVGLGILLGSPSIYGYGSINVNGSQDSFYQAGLGVDI
jgi:hypothetical protein